MKHWLILLLAVVLVLSGCDGEPIPETTQPTHSTTVETTEPVPGPSLYTADSRLETETQGAVQVFLPKTGVVLTYGFMGDDPVLFSRDGEDAIHATRICADTGEILAEGTLPSDVDLWMGLGLGPDSLICFDTARNLLLIYDGQFRELRTLPVPENITGSLVISEDLSKAYYGLEGALYVLDLHTELSRLVMQMGDMSVYPNSLLFRDTILYCHLSGFYDSYDAFVSVEDGRILGREENLVSMETWDDTYVAYCVDGPAGEVFVGTRGGEKRVLQAENDFCSVELLPRTGRLVEDMPLETGTGVQIYAPETGNCLGKLFLEAITWVGNTQEDAHGRVWFLTTDADQDVLCRWDPMKHPANDDVQRIGPHYTVDNPDLEGLARCEERAQQMEAKYGVDICLYKDFVEPNSYAVTPEHQIRLIEAGLDELDRAMAKFPEGFFRKAASVTESGVFSISLVRELTGTEYNTLPDAGGLQYWVDGNAYIALKTGYGVETNFYHELCHAIETYVVGNSIHYDFWDDNNPKDFAYDYCYTEYTKHGESPWLQDETRAFIDSYSMTYPIEDRARMLEYAMTDGNERYFATETMQAKLKQLCMAIRQAFGWKKSQETFPWEQYLTESLAYVSKKK